MNMQVLLEKSSIFTKVLKDQMDRTCEKHAAIPVATLNRPTKTKLKQCPGQSGRRASGRGKRARVESDDERDSEDEGGQDLRSASVKVLANNGKPAFLQPALVTGAHFEGLSAGGRRLDGQPVGGQHFRDFGRVIATVVHREVFY